MNIFWASLIVGAIAMFLFAVLPSIVEKPPSVPLESQVDSQQRRYATVPHMSPGMSTPEDKAMLDSHYAPARATVPQDYPRQEIGACPYSKAPSTDLPIRNLPMCVIQKSETMKMPSTSSCK